MTLSCKTFQITLLTHPFSPRWIFPPQLELGSHQISIAHTRCLTVRWKHISNLHFTDFVEKQSLLHISISINILIMSRMMIHCMIRIVLIERVLMRRMTLNLRWRISWIPIHRWMARIVIITGSTVGVNFIIIWGWLHWSSHRRRRVWSYRWGLTRRRDKPTGSG